MKKFEQDNLKYLLSASGHTMVGSVAGSFFISQHSSSAPYLTAEDKKMAREGEALWKAAFEMPHMDEEMLHQVMDDEAYEQLRFLDEDEYGDSTYEVVIYHDNKYYRFQVTENAAACDDVRWAFETDEWGVAAKEVWPQKFSDIRYTDKPETEEKHLSGKDLKSTTAIVKVDPSPKYQAFFSICIVHPDQPYDGVLPILHYEADSVTDLNKAVVADIDKTCEHAIKCEGRAPGKIRATQSELPEENQ